VSAGPPRPKGAPLSKQESEKLAGQIRPVWDTVPLASQPQKSAAAPSPALGEAPTISAVSQSPALGEAPTISAVSKSPALSEGPTISAISPSPALDEPRTITAIADSPAVNEGPTISVMSSAGPLIPQDDEDVLTSVTPKYELPDAKPPAAPPRPPAPSFGADREDPTFVSQVMEVGDRDVLPSVHDEPTLQVPPGQEAQFLAERERMLGAAKPDAPTPGGDRTQDIQDNDLIDDPSVIKKPTPQSDTIPRAQKALVGLNELPTRPTEFGVVPIEAIGGGSNMTPHPPFELLEDPASPNAPTAPGGQQLIARRQQNRVRSFALGASAAIVAIIGIGVVVKLAFGEPTGSALPPPGSTTKTTAASPPPKTDPPPAPDPETAKADPAPADTAKADPPAPAATDSSSGWSGSPPAPIAATPAGNSRPAHPQTAPASQPQSQPQPRATSHPSGPAHPSGGGGGKSGKGTGIVRDTPF
jgi:hypothetical protein